MIGTNKDIPDESEIFIPFFNTKRSTELSYAQLELLQEVAKSRLVSDFKVYQEFLKRKQLFTDKPGLFSL